MANFDFSENRELYTVEVAANDPPLFIVTTYDEKTIVISMDEMSIKGYKRVPFDFGIDREGVFQKPQYVVDVWNQTKQSRPFASLFNKGERELFQCEFDEYCATQAKYPDGSFYKENCQGNIIMWNKMKTLC